MKLGILLCDHVRQSLQTEHGDYPQMFKQIIAKTQLEIDIKYYAVVDGIFPTDIHECDCYMTSGSRFSVNDDLPWIKQLEEFVKILHLAKKGLAGICFGHQLIAKVLGGKVEKSSKGWGIGIAKSSIVTTMPWMKNNISNVNLIVSHQDQVTETPAEAEVLMTSNFCPATMFTVGKHFVAIQGHPEFTPKYSHALMLARRDVIPSTRIEEGIASLSNKADDVLVMEWLLTFLQQTITL